jgi:hypothetical protein
MGTASRLVQSRRPEANCGLFSIPIDHVLVYAPRNEVELEAAMPIVKASIQYMTESWDQLEGMSSLWRSGDPRAWFT